MQILMMVAGWMAVGALLGLLARGLFVVHRQVAMLPAIGSGVAGALIGGLSTSLVLGDGLGGSDSSWAGCVGGSLLALGMLALVTTHRSRTAKVR